MLTSQVELAANRGDIATADFNIPLVLRSGVIPAFLADVDRIDWKRKCFTFVPTTGQQYQSLPNDFFEILDVVIVGGKDPIDFVGDDPWLVTKAESNATAGVWTGYYLIRNPNNPTGWAIKFNAPMGSAAPPVVHVHYYWYLPFEDSEDLDLREYIPETYHWALVELLRREIIDDRFGQGDQRYSNANAKYQEWIKRITTKRALAPRGSRADYVR